MGNRPFAPRTVAEMGFWAMHLDSLFWSFALGALFCWFFARMAKTRHLREFPTPPRDSSR